MEADLRVEEAVTPSFEDWVRPHLSVLSAIAARSVGRDDAADVVQNALLRAWRRWGTYSADRGAPRAWLIAILLDQSRRLRVARRPVTLLPDRPVPASDGLRVDVEAAVRRLPRRQQQVVVLYYLADLSVQDVAHVLEIGQGSVKSHLSAAREALRGLLAESSRES